MEAEYLFPVKKGLKQLQDAEPIFKYNLVDWT